MTADLNGYQRVLAVACARAGLDHTGAEPLRMGENAMFSLPGHVVARISRPGQAAIARREVQVARWLAEQEIPAVTALDVDQPVESDGQAVTFWHQLPPHRHGTPAEVADALRQLHSLTPPAEFAALDPFTRLTERIDAAATLTEDDRAWLRQHVATLRTGYEHRPAGLPARVVHGDAWVGNVVTTHEGRTVLLDLERCSVGPPEWDLVSTAIKHTSFGWITDHEYREFCDRYRHDVTTWDGFGLLRDIRELRMTCYLAQHAAEDSAARDQAALRVACLRGSHGPRPWRWTSAL